MSLLARSVSGLVPLDQTVEVLKPTEVLNPNYTGESYLNWSIVTVTATLAGRLVPASTRALERAGRVGRVGVWELFTEPTTAIAPLGRVRVGAQQYSVIDSRSYRERAHAIIEEVSA